MEILRPAECRAIEGFLKEFFGADTVEIADYEPGDEYVDIYFTHTYFHSDDGEREDILQVARLMPNEKLANIIELARAMRDTFPETSYPK